MSVPAKPLNWGLIGTSTVAHQFCTQLGKLPSAKLVHVVGTSPEKARTFASTFKAPRSSDSVDALIADESVDVVQIASPTRYHAEQALAALEGGKAVVCEKPFCTDSASFNRITELAKGKGLFCMEGMWMRFNPLVQLARDLVASGKLGTIRHVRAEIGYKSSLDRLDDPHRGPVWDFSVYALSLFTYLLGKPPVGPISWTEPAEHAGTVSGTCAWESATGSFTASIEVEAGNEAEIIGTEGRLVLGPPFICPPQLRSTIPLFGGSPVHDRIARVMEVLRGRPVRETRFLKLTDPQSGFYHQALEADRCIRAGLSESPVVPHADTLDVIRMAESLQASL